jgi:hypothetical protein
MFYKINHHNVQHKKFSLYKRIEHILNWIFSMQSVIFVYNLISNRHECDHVGISLGYLQAGEISLLPYDISCWNGRTCGFVALKSDVEQCIDKHTILCVDGFYLETTNEISNAIVKYTTQNIRYPTVWKLIFDFITFFFCYLYNKICEKCTPVCGCRTKKTDPYTTESIAGQNWDVHQYMTCTQFVLLVCRQCILAGGGAKGSLLREMEILTWLRTCLHPYSIRVMILRNPNFFQIISKVNLIDIKQTTKKTVNILRLFLPEPWDEKIPITQVVYNHTNQNGFANTYDLFFSIPKNEQGLG